MNKGYEDLEVWKLSKSLAVEVYKITEKFPKNEQFGITSQIRRAVVSIASNIAEGQVRESKADFARFLGISLGSTAELKTQLIISSELNFLCLEDFNLTLEKINRIARMLKSLKTSLKNM